MKFIFSLIIAVVVYLGLGLVAWNIVYSFLDIDHMTLVSLADARIYTYSGFTLLGYLILSFLYGDSPEYLFYIIIINGAIAILFNQWGNAWDSVILIVSIIYNLVNIGILTMMMYDFHIISK